MSFLTAYREGLSTIFRHRRMWAQLFFLNILFVGIIAHPMKSLLSDTIGHSLDVNRSLGRFDYPFLSDFLNLYGDRLNVILDHSFAIILLYFVFSVFLMGGILTTVVHNTEKYKFSEFWSGSARYFWRIFRLTFYFLVIHVLVFLLVGSLFAKGGLNPLEMESDVTLIKNLQWAVPLLVILSILVAMFHDYAKIRIVSEDANPIAKAIVESVRWVFRNFFKCLALYLLNFLIALILLGIYWWLQEALQPDSIASIFLAFFLTQIFIVLRIGMKLQNLASAQALIQLEKQKIA